MVVFGGTSAQGIPVVKGMLINFAFIKYTLTPNSVSNLRQLQYAPRVLIRNVDSPNATALAAFSHVTIVPFKGSNDTDIRRVLAGADSTFTNT